MSWKEGINGLLGHPAARRELAEEEARRDRWNHAQYKAEKTLAEIHEQNEAAAFNLGFKNVEAYFAAVNGKNGREILKIAMKQGIDWEQARTVFEHQLERRDQRAWKVGKILRKSEKPSGEGSYALTPGERKIRDEVTGKGPKQSHNRHKSGLTRKEKYRLQSPFSWRQRLSAWELRLKS